MNEGCLVLGGEVIKSGVGVIEPSLEPLRARGELALWHIWVGPGLHSRCKKNLDHDLEVHQRLGELQAPERKNPFGESLYKMKEWPAEKRRQ
jgi:hypothetical protein